MYFNFNYYFIYLFKLFFSQKNYSKIINKKKKIQLKKTANGTIDFTNKSLSYTIMIDISNAKGPFTLYILADSLYPITIEYSIGITSLDDREWISIDSNQSTTPFCGNSFVFITFNVVDIEISNSSLDYFISLENSNQDLGIHQCFGESNFSFVILLMGILIAVFCSGFCCFCCFCKLFCCSKKEKQNLIYIN